MRCCCQLSGSGSAQAPSLGRIPLSSASPSGSKSDWAMGVETGLGWMQQPMVGDGGVPSKGDGKHYHTEWIKYVLYKWAKDGLCILALRLSVSSLQTEAQ